MAARRASRPWSASMTSGRASARSPSPSSWTARKPPPRPSCTAGTAEVALIVKGAKGTARESLTIVGGDHKLSLTPPMGWNSWNVWAGAVDADKTRAAADAMVASGLAAHGYQYVNIDDTWEGA